MDPDALTRLVQGLSPEQLAELVDGLSPDEVVTLAEAVPRTEVREDPAARGPAELATRFEPAYRTPTHVQLLSDAIRQAVEDAQTGAGPGRLIVSMPPRSGKSFTTSLWTPVWFLERYPHKHVILASHDANFAVSWSRKVRDTHLRLTATGATQARVSRAISAASEWETTQGGGMLARGIGGSITGRGAHLLIIDDPIKDFAQAHSAAIRQAQWDWWLSTASTRLEPGGVVVVVQCVTGDTQVLRPDGTSTLLCDIRPGDAIATYEAGRLTTSTVRNWANQGPDGVYEIRMASGRKVRANTRHPFLTVDESGAERWQRTDELEPGARILAATGPGSPAPPRAATDRSWSVTPDTVVEVVPAGREDVYDLQVDRTENFIANGLVSHNTRWHEDDLVGRLLSRDQEGDPDEWTVLRIPALGEGTVEDVESGKVPPDALARPEGAPLVLAAVSEPPEVATTRWERIRRQVGPYIWAGLYQQRPSEPEGTILKRAWWQFYRRSGDQLLRPDGTAVDIGQLRIIQSWDMAFKDKAANDYVCGQVWGAYGQGDRFLLDQVHDRLDFVSTKRAMRRLRARWPDTTATYVEDTANGPAIISELRRELSGLLPVTVKGSKEARAWSIQGDLEAGSLWLPIPDPDVSPWVGDLIQQCAEFPNGAHDDQVDALTQAIERMRRGQGEVLRPTGSRQEGSLRVLPTTRQTIRRA
jgi:predicted phage terminase large subunit-like protein